MEKDELLEEQELCKQLKELDFSVFSNNRVRSVPWHCHGHVEVLYLVSGRCRLVLHERQLQMDSEELMVLAAWEPHRIEAEEDCDFRVVQCSQSFFVRDEPGDELFCLFQALLCGESPMENPVVFTDGADWMAAMLREYEEQMPGYVTVIRGLILRLLVSVYRKGAIPGVAPVWGQQTDRRAFLKLLFWIQGNLDRCLKAGEAAKQMHVSTSHFSRLFRERTGQGFCAYVREERIRKAKGLLLAETLRITEVALECGFSDGAYFSRVFRRSTGMSPGEFRAQKYPRREH